MRAYRRLRYLPRLKFNRQQFEIGDHRVNRRDPRLLFERHREFACLRQTLRKLRGLARERVEQTLRIAREFVVRTEQRPGINNN